VSLDAANIVSLIGALGIGSVIGQWFTASKDRKTARAAVLKELALVEEARWYQDGPETDSPKLSIAIRQLETAALIGRVPRACHTSNSQLLRFGSSRMKSSRAEIPNAPVSTCTCPT
jgi:hypothetical protein